MGVGTQAVFQASILSHITFANMLVLAGSSKPDSGQIAAMIGCVLLEAKCATFH